MSALWFVRHGSTTWSERGRMQGWTPIGLSALGVRDAREIGRRARSLGIRRILTSPLLRACETAQLVARHLSVPVHVSYALRELNYGALTGCTREEVRASHPALAQAWEDQPWRVRFTSSHGALSDLAAALEPLLDDTPSPPGPTLCITHGHVIRAALTVQHALQPRDFWRTEVPAGSMWLMSHDMVI